MKDGERQVAPTLDGIRYDHVARYQWAAQIIGSNRVVIDFACGVGYGSKILADAGNTVLAYDIDQEAIDYGCKHFVAKHLTYQQADAANPPPMRRAAFGVCFETVEHIADPRPLLRALRQSCAELLVSVPNEDALPFGGGFEFHHRHYTRGQFAALLRECGWNPLVYKGQEGPESPVDDSIGRTILAICERCEEVAPSDAITESAPRIGAPEHVVILGMGPSLDQYTNIVKRLGGRNKYADEVWTINALGAVFDSDLVFHMDDVRIQEIRATERPESNIAGMLQWMRKTPVPIMTSRPHPDYPSTIAFPLIEMLNDVPYGYFNSTAAYAVAYAVLIGVKKLSIFGCDYTYPNAHDAEKGRACVEFWLGIATERGIKITVPKNTTLLDALHTQRERFYGYDTVDMNIHLDKMGAVDIEFTERGDLPSAAEIEAAYDHDRHPNALMVEVK